MVELRKEQNMLATENRTIEVPLMTAGSTPGEVTAKIQIPESLAILDLGQDKGINHGQFIILTKKDGDKRVVWDRMNLLEIRDAKTMFDRMVGEGMTPYRVSADGQPSAEVVKVFDPAAEEIVFLPTRALKKG
jgi:hypothetical protein